MRLLFIAVSAAFFDSFNPVVLAQTFWLLARAKEPKRIFWYTLSVGATNMALGLTVYHTINTALQQHWQLLAHRVARALPTAQILLGALALGGLFCMLLRRKTAPVPGAAAPVVAGGKPPEPSKNAGREYTTPQLVLSGISGAVCEISSSLPYFAFIGALLGAPPASGRVLLLLVYNLIFTLPLNLLVILCIHRRQWVDRVYRFLAGRLFYCGEQLLPYLIGAGGCAFILRGLWNLAR